MRGLVLFLFISTLPLALFSQCYYYDLFPSKNRVDDLFGSCIVALDNNEDFIAVGVTASANNNGTFYVNRISCGDTLWQQVYNFYPVGGEGPERALLNKNGNILLLGVVSDTVENARDNFILEIGIETGEVSLYKRIDAGYNDYGWDIKQTADRGYVIGGVYWSDGGLFLTKTDESGNVIWQKDYELSRENRLQSIDITTDNGFILGGYCYDSIFSTNFFLIKTDSLGNQLWSKTYGEDGFHKTRGHVITTLDGGFLQTGYRVPYPEPNFLPEMKPYIIKMDSAGEVEWTKTYTITPNFPNQFKQARQLPDSSFLFTGNIRDTTHPNTPSHVMLAKTDKNGNIKWVRQHTYYGGSSDNYVEDISISDEGDIATTGYIIHDFGFNDMYVLKTDSCGYTSTDTTIANFNFTFLDSTIVAFENISSKVCSHQWYFGDNGNTSTEWNPIYVFLENGTFPVTLITRAANSIDTFTQMITIEHVGIPQADEMRFKVYPNPSDGSFVIEYSSDSQNLRFELYNVIGSLRFTLLLPNGYNKITAAPKELDSGCYLYNFRSEKEVIESGKIIVLKK